MSQEVRLCACGQPVHPGTVMASAPIAAWTSGLSTLTVADSADYIVRYVAEVPRRGLMVVSMTRVECAHHVGEMMSWGYTLGTVTRCGTVAEIPQACVCSGHCADKALIRAAWESRH